MNRRQNTTTRKVRMVLLGIGLTTALAFTGTGVHAAWTAHTSTTATATTAATAFNSASSLNALAATYSVASYSEPKTLTFHNTGSAPLELRGVAISATGSVPGSEFRLHVWEKGSGICAATPPATGVWTTTLAANTNVTVAGLPVLPATATKDLCAATQYLGAPTAIQRVATFMLTFTAGVGANWTAVDSSVATQRTFTQTVRGVTAPSGLTCAEGAGYRLWIIVWLDYKTVLMNWVAPTGGADEYRIYYRPSNGTPIRVATTNNLSADINPQDNASGGQLPNGDGHLFVRSVRNNVESANSQELPVRVSSPYWSNRSIECR